MHEYSKIFFCGPDITHCELSGAEGPSRLYHAFYFQACKQTLKQLGPLLGSESLNDMFQKYLIEDAKLYYGEFLNDICKIMVVDFTDKVPLYVMGNVTHFKSQWAEIRGNAAIYLGEDEGGGVA